MSYFFILQKKKWFRHELIAYFIVSWAFFCSWSKCLVSPIKTCIFTVCYQFNLPFIEILSSLNKIIHMFTKSRDILFSLPLKITKFCINSNYGIFTWIIQVQNKIYEVLLCLNKPSIFTTVEDQRHYVSNADMERD